MDSDHLIAHLANLEPELRADRILGRDDYLSDVFDDLTECLQAWDGGDLPELFTSARSGVVAYGLARLVYTAPGFTAAQPSHAAEIDPIGVDEFERVVAGDLRVDGEVDLYEGEALIVLGDLHANTISADETGHVIVAGTVTARTIWSEGNVLANNIDAHLVHGSYSAGILGVTDTLRTRLLVNSQQHDFIAGRVEADFVVDENRHSSDSPELTRLLDELASRVPPAVVGSSGDTGAHTVGRVDMRALRQHVAGGGSPLLG